MSAQDNLNGQQFFHGSRHEFNPGDVLTPEGAEEHRNYLGSGHKSVFYTNDAGLAASYSSGGTVYRVTPLPGRFKDQKTNYYKDEPGGPRGVLQYTTRNGLRVEGSIAEEERQAALDRHQDRWRNSRAGREQERRNGL